MKKIFKYSLVVALICLAGYLTFSLVYGNIVQKQADQTFCAANCNYSPYSYFWEFSGGNAAIGFTTEDECLSYCTKSREGLVYGFVSDSYASFISSPFVSNFLKFVHLK
jgi:hypothetical protein